MKEVIKANSDEDFFPEILALRSLRSLMMMLRRKKLKVKRKKLKVKRKRRRILLIIQTLKNTSKLKKKNTLNFRVSFENTKMNLRELSRNLLMWYDFSYI